MMHLCCFADDPREPDLIGDCKVDLTEVFTKGETDGAKLSCHFAGSLSIYIRMVHA